MGNFFAELKRRKVFRVVAAYAVVGWLLIQLVNETGPIPEAPEWLGKVVLMLLAVAEGGQVTKRPFKESTQ